MNLILRLFLTAAILFPAVLKASVVVCNGCGWELASDAAACGRCGWVVPGAAAVHEEEKSEPAEKPDRAPDGLIADAVVDAEVRLSREYAVAGDKGVALFVLKNASIMNMLSKSAGDETRSGAMIRMMSLLDDMGGMVETKCVTCNGSGRRVMRTSSIIPGETGGTREVHGSSCPVCSGNGVLRRTGNLDERKVARGRAESKYTTIQQNRNFRRIGGAWLPVDSAEKLSVKQTALVRAASVGPCEDCLGSGKTDCPGCSATGFVECKKCEGGNVFIKSEGSLVKGSITRSEKCKECKGRGVLSCQSCSGTGGLLCKQCNGRGDRPECKACGSAGYTDCRKCSGSGKVGDELCDACGGGGAVICTSCKGDGRK